MQRLYVCGEFAQQTIDILQAYNSSDIQVVQKQVGIIKATVTLELAKDSSILLLVVDKSVYAKVEPFITDILVNRVYKYTDDDSLRNVLLEKLGSPDGSDDFITKMVASAEDLELNETLSTQLQDKDSEITQLKEQLAQQELIVKELTSRLEEQDSEDDASDFIAQIKQLNEDIEGYKDQIKDAESKLQEANNTISELQNSEKNSVDSEAVLQLQQELTAVQNELQSEKQKNALASFNDETSASELFKANADITILTQEKEKLAGDIEDLKNQLAEANGNLESKGAEITGLNEKITKLKEEVERNAGIKTNLENTQLELDNLKVDLENANNTIKAKDEQLAEKDEAIASAAAGNTEVLAEKDEEIAKKTAEIVEKELALEAQKADYEAKIKNLSSQDGSEKEVLNNKIADLQQQISEKDIAYETLEGINTDLTGQLTTAQADLAKANNAKSKFEGKYNDEKEKADKLSAENETLTTKNSELSGENVKLKVQLESAQKIANAKSDITSLEQENKNLNYKIKKLEEELQSSELSPVFKDMNQESGYLTGVTKLRLDTVNGINPNKVIVVASGSVKSYTDTADTIARTCKMTEKRIIVVDLEQDTCLDVALQCDGSKKALEWLKGSIPAQDAVARCKNLKNTLYIGFLSQYLNNTALLGINWQEKIDELSALCDLVIIHTGCITSLVPSILFNTFTETVQGHIILNGSHVSSRGCLFSLWGFDKSLLTNVQLDIVNREPNQFITPLEKRLRIVDFTRSSTLV